MKKNIFVTALVVIITPLLVQPSIKEIFLIISLGGIILHLFLSSEKRLKYDIQKLKKENYTLKSDLENAKKIIEKQNKKELSLQLIKEKKEELKNLEKGHCTERDSLYQLVCSLTEEKKQLEEKQQDLFRQLYQLSKENEELKNMENAKNSS